MRRQLGELRDARGQLLHKGGVMLVPAIASLDAWERLAVAQQNALIDASAEDRTKPGEPVVTKEETKDEAALAAHRTSEALYQKEKCELPQVIRAYLNAQASKAR